MPVNQGFFEIINHFIVKTSAFCIIEVWQEKDISYFVSQIFRNRGDKVSEDTKQIEEVMAKRTAKNSVFLDLFQNKSYLLKLYKTLHPEDTTATEDSLTDVTITNVLMNNLYNDLGFIANNKLMILVEVTIMMSLFDDEQIMKSFIKSERHDTERAMAEQLIRKGKMTLEEIADCVSTLSFDELKEIETEIMQLA